jgi:hypothetical protein
MGNKNVGGREAKKKPKPKAKPAPSMRQESGAVVTSHIAGKHE